MKRSNNAGRGFFIAAAVVAVLALLAAGAWYLYRSRQAEPVPEPQTPEPEAEEKTPSIEIGPLTLEEIDGEQVGDGYIEDGEVKDAAGGSYYE